MISLLLVLGLGLALSLALVPLARALALRLGLVDRPDGHRKIHERVTPVSGGIAILLAFTGALAAVFVWPDSPLASHVREHGQQILGLLLGAVVICLVGITDDLGKLRGRHKLAGQLLAVSIVVALGDYVRSLQLFGVQLELGWLGVPFTIFLMLGAINSLNLIDGMDGLLGSVGVILGLALAAMAALAGHWWAAVVALALAGALLGFLRHNLPPATIFMGDSGSMLVGLVLGTLAIRCSLKAPATIAIALPVVLLILPIFDTAAAIVRRTLTGRSIYTSDRGHLHHCLLRSGLSTPWALVVVSLFCLLGCASVLASQAFENEWIALITAGAIVGILITTRLFGHAEALLIKGRLLGLIVPAATVRQMEVRLQGSADWNELWHALTGSAAELKLEHMLLDVNAPSLHEGYHARWDQGCAAQEGRPRWQVEIPMSANGLSVGRLVLAGKPDAQPVWIKIERIMRVMHEVQHPLAALMAKQALDDQTLDDQGLDADLEAGSIAAAAHATLPTHAAAATASALGG